MIKKSAEPKAKVRELETVTGELGRDRRPRDGVLTIAGLNAGTLKWLLDRQRQGLDSKAARWNDLEWWLYELRASLPLEYVRRED